MAGRYLSTKLKYFIVAGVSGVTIVGGGLYYKPDLMSIVYQQKIQNSSADEKLKLIHTIENPFDVNNFRKMKQTSSTARLTYEEWSNLVDKYEKQLGKSIFGKIDGIKDDVYVSLKTKTSDNPREMIQNIISLYGDTIEAKNKIDQYISEYLESHEWIAYEDIKQLDNHDFKKAKSPMVNMMIGVILMCPVDVNKIIEYLYEPHPDPEDKLYIIRKHFDKLTDQEQQYIVQEVLVQVIEYLRSINKFELITDPLKKLLLQSPLISSSMASFVDDFIKVLSKLKNETNAKILKVLIINQRNETKMIAEMVTTLGPIGIKLAQMYVENPLTPVKWRNILANCREENPPMSFVDIFRKFNIRGEITHFGKCIGVGSIKQIYHVRNGELHQILGVTKIGIEEDSMEIINAIQTVRSMRKVANDLKKIIQTEIILFNEQDTYGLMDTPRFKQSNLLTLPTVVSASSTSMVRNHIKGDTIAKIIKQNKMTPGIVSCVDKLHKLMIDSAFIDGVVLSDLHFGNYIYNPETEKLTIIDVGQYCGISKREIMMYMWLVADIMSPEDKYIHSVNMGKLVEFLNIKPEDIAKIDDIIRKAHLIPEEKTRILFVIADLNSVGYETPSSFLSCSKMFDTILSQRSTLGLKEDDIMTQFKDIFKSYMTYSDYGSLGYSYCKSVIWG